MPWLEPWGVGGASAAMYHQRYVFHGFVDASGAVVISQRGWVVKKDVIELTRMGIFQRKNSHGVH
jgi:hypothetical protein